MERGRFPNKLKKYRHCAGCAQKKVAHMLGLTDASLISKWEKGKSSPSLVHVFRLARIYNTLPHVLFDTLWIESVPERSLLTHKESSSIQESFSV